MIFSRKVCGEYFYSIRKRIYRTQNFAKDKIDESEFILWNDRRNSLLHRKKNSMIYLFEIYLKIKQLHIYTHLKFILIKIIHIFLRENIKAAHIDKLFSYMSLEEEFACNILFYVNIL